MIEDDFGDRMKGYEAVETARRLDVHLPVYARVDGRAFSTFTRGMQRPFDRRMTTAMVDTAAFLVEKSHARIGYAQSDEISLVWLAEGEASDIFFSGKIQKMVSVIASMAAAKFASLCPENYRHRLPHFDTRVFQLPSKTEAANAILWRAMDARKNAIQAAAQAAFSTKELFRKSQSDMLKMLDELGIDFEQFPADFKRGTFVQRRTELRELTGEELATIPAEYRPDGPVERSSVAVLDMPPFNKVANREAVIFDAAPPILVAE